MRRPEERALIAELVAARKAAGLRQRDVADRLHTCVSAICNLETRNDQSPLLNTLLRYAEAIGVRLSITTTPIEGETP